MQKTIIPFRVLSTLLIAILLTSCASLKKTPKESSIPATKLTPATAVVKDANDSKIQHVNTEQFNKLLLLKDVQLVDVRTKEEFDSGHIKNADNINVKDSEFKNNVSKLKKDKPVLLYCRSGKRSTDAAEILKEMGFTKLVSLDGGILSWEEAKLPISK